MENYNNIILDFEPVSRRIHLLHDITLYQMLIDSGIRISSLCGGIGSCGKCKVLIQKGLEFLNHPSNAELEFLEKGEIEKGWRLACQCRIDNNKIKQIKQKPTPQFRIFLPHELLIEDFKILTSGLSKGINLNPNIKKFFIQANKPSLDHPIADFENIISNLKQQINNLSINEPIEIEYNVLKSISEILRTSQFEITLTLMDGNKIIDFEPGNCIEKNFGIAFDIGTTTIVGYLINLNDGKIHAVDSVLNPQTAYGEDVVTRISYINENEDGLQILNSAVIEALNKIIKKTCALAKITPFQIYEATIVGNSVMHHIFLGLSPISIGLSPYIPVIQKGSNFKAKKLNLTTHTEANVYTLPLVAGFVGADTIGVILSSEIDKELDLTLAIDIGTNGEIIIGNRDILAVGSCAAGSALEGAHIKDGMRAAAGAIDSIKIHPENLKVSYTTIKNKKPIGICGSGLIDAVAEMLKSHIISRNGNFNKELIKSNQIIKKDKGYAFILVKKNETSIGKDIIITQNDIREIQMAKGAFFSGTRLILNYLSQKHNLDSNIKQIFLAGAFGNYINKKNAKFIGMIPDIDDDKIFQIGNAAGIGAQYCLMNKELRKKAQNLLNVIKYVEIALEKEFQMEFARAMYFPHLNLDLFPNLKEYKNIPKR